MIKGIGVDIVSFESLSPKLERPPFVEKVFTPQEIQDCRGHKQYIQRFAGKFAAKEAFMKALGKGIRQEIWFLQIEVLNNEYGAPFIKLTGKAKHNFNELGNGSIHLSISHTKSTAVAVVILESDENRDLSNHGT